MRRIKIKWDKLPIRDEHKFSDGSKIVVYNADSIYSDGRIKSAERNAFYFEKDGLLRWQVAVRQPLERGSSFQAYRHINNKSGRLFDDSGSSYMVDLQTGKLEFFDWAK